MAHVWITGAADRDALAAAAAVTAAAAPAGPGPVWTIDAHRRHRGPYTAVGTLLREIVPVALRQWPELATEHDIAILCVAPELRDVLPASRETLTSLAVPEERTRFYARARTLRLAHGVTEFLRDHLRRAGGPAPRLVVHRAGDADPTDQEFLAVALRRIDPALLTITVCTGPDLPDGPLAEALSRYAERVEAPSVPAPHVENPVAHYLDGDCVDDDPALVAAYEALPAAERARLHDERADRLEALGEPSLTTGAIPYHREHGADPAGRGADALLAALNYCVNMGFYAATVDFGTRGRAVVDWARQDGAWWAFTTKMTTSLSALGRPEEAEALYDEARAFCVDPLIHRQAAYATAMIYTRHHAPEDRDHHRARGWINQAILIARLMDDVDGFPVVFQLNGLALIEMHLGNLEGALRLVDEGLATLDRRLGSGEHLLHRSVLQHNRSNVFLALGRPAEALADLEAVIEVDPNYAEYHFDRGNLLRRLGRDDEALAEYATAIRLSPPFPEPFYNRADLLLDRGDVEGALADLDEVLDLDPTMVDAYINRAGIHVALEDALAARRDVDAGLALSPNDPHLLCLLGQAYALTGDTAPATAAFTAAAEAAPELAAAWAGLADLAAAAGDPGKAVRYLDRALTGEDDPALRYNRALALRAAGEDEAALADLTRALELAPDDPELLEARAAWSSAEPAGVA